VGLNVPLYRFATGKCSNLLCHRPVPFLMITNGGGMTEADRIKALTRDLGVPVSAVTQSFGPT
jgi:ribonucleotide monophosphatase NagD (HAD superfamily)